MTRSPHPSSPRWDVLEPLFTAVAELPPAERAAYLDKACSDDPALRLQVESLLSASDRASGFLGEVIAGTAQEVLQPGRPGDRVGAYEIVRELGRGGMGAVYLGRRADEAYEAQVAIKLIGGFHTDDRLQRFRTERQILASLRHPHIARLLDGGTTEAGVPYVVMEYVDGTPIDRYCEERGLGLEERLVLFEKVCEAVAYAHGRLVVHCDLKPGNILVEPDGTPKLLDFGIARLVEPDASGTVTLTPRLGTPAYASPEQVLGDPVTVATDVHGLGVVLYELLTGRLPYPGGPTPGELRRRVVQAEPVAPSRVVEPGRSRALRGDLDAIVLTALEKEPSRRYPSAERLAEDLRRHRHQRPVRARPRSWSYRAGRFLRRHRLAVSAAALVLLVLAGFVGALAVQADRVARERDQARLARASAEEVSTFLVDLFEWSDPNQTAGAEVTARELLDRGAERLAGLDSEPATRATMMDAIGRVYQNLGLYDRAGPLLDSALAIRRSVYGESHPEVAASLHAKGVHRAMLGDYDGAAGLLRRALAIRRTLPPDDPGLPETLHALADVESDAGDYEAAAPLRREAVALERARYGDEHPAIADGLVNLGGLLRRQGDYAAAEPLLREGLAMRRRLLGSEHLDVAHALNQLGRLLVLEGRASEALPYIREGLEIRTRILGPEHVEVGASLGNLAGALGEAGDRAGAIEARRHSLEVIRHNFDDDHPYVSATLQSLAALQQEAGMLDSARANYAWAVEVQRRVLRPGDPNRAFALTGLGRVLNDLGRPGEAEPHLREALALRRDGLPDGHWYTAATETALGTSLTLLGRYDEAEALLTRAQRTLRDQLGDDDARTRQARDRLAALHQMADGAGHGSP